MTEAPGVDQPGLRDQADGALVTVRLIDLPVPEFAAAQEHSEELMRELTHVANQIATTHAPDGAQADAASYPSRELPVRLMALVEDLSAGYSGFTVEQEQQLASAVEAGRESIPELTYEVPAAAAGAAKHLGAMLDEADDYCRRGQHLLTLATPPELVAFRRWYLSEFENQIAGQPPTSWPSYRAATGD
jgi:hypothetical protein